MSRLISPRICSWLLAAAAGFHQIQIAVASDDSRPRLIIETDAGGDPDDEQSLVRLLVYANEFDVEGIIANRPSARDGENLNPIRDGLGIVRAAVQAYGECYPNLVQHDPRYPAPERLLDRTVAGYTNVDDGVELIIRAVDAPDPRPIWFSNWGTDAGSSPSCLLRALDRVRSERGPKGYAKFKNRLLLSSSDRFGDHTANIDPPFPFFLDALQPPLDGKRWYHRFSALTATAGGFDIQRDVLTNHGPLGALYPTNTGLPQKEGDTMLFLYLVPTGMNDPLEPTWGSWAGRYGLNDTNYPGRKYYWSNQSDTWQGSSHRDNTLARWAADLQHDFAARMDWCVAAEYAQANHRPQALLNGDATQQIIYVDAAPNSTVQLSAAGSADPDHDPITVGWSVYPEAGTYHGEIDLSSKTGEAVNFVAPAVTSPQTIHLILRVSDHGSPPLAHYRRAVIRVRPE
ncbi:MAG: DUF1593 domain-containing protein [Pirellulales bacterium]